MSVFWFERSADSIPSHDGWLGAAELACLAAFRFPKRRADWLLGRWTAKCAVASVLNEPSPFADIEIRAAPSGAPTVYIRGQPAPVKISLSHRAGIACCATTLDAIALGCDLEVVEPRSPAFVSDYFTREERDLIARSGTAERPRLVTLLWSAKESALKALGVGLRADTRSVSVAGLHESGCLTLRCAAGELYGWWQSAGQLVRTLVCACGPGELRGPDFHGCLRYD